MTGRMLETARPAPARLGDVFKVDAWDVYLMFGMVCSVAAVWAAGYLTVGLDRVFRFWDGVNFLVWRRRDRGWVRTHGDPYARYVGRGIDECITPLRFHFWLVNVFVTLCFGKCVMGQMLYAAVMSSLSVFLFRKVLFAYGFAQDSVFLSAVFIAVPPQWVLFRSTATYDSLLLCLMLLSLLLYKTDHPLLLLGVCLIGCATRFEFVMMFLVFGICYFLARRNLYGITSIACGVLVAIFLTNAYPEWRRYIVPNALNKGAEHEHELFVGTPFGLFWKVRGSIHNLRLIHVLHMVWFPSFFGAALLYTQSLPLSVCSLIYSLFLTTIQSRDMNRFAIPAHALFLIGIGFFLKHPPVKFVLSVVGPLAFLVEVWACRLQLQSRQLHVTL